MGKFNSDGHYIYYCGQESLRRNRVALIVNKRVWNAVLGCSLKNDRIICLFPRQTIQYHSNPRLYHTNNAEEDLQDLLELTPQKDALFIIGDWNTKVGSQETPRVTGKYWPWNTEWSRTKANRVLPREHIGHSKQSLPTTQEKTLHMDITRWSILKSDWLYSLQPKMEKLYTVSKNKTRSWLWLRSWTPYCQIQT